MDFPFPLDAVAMCGVLLVAPVVGCILGFLGCCNIKRWTIALHD